ncbi:DUF4173 domain-containing protein [Microbispora sp. RL4-1S]|uniref:DUF4173 domain-containing protein n=2 Tax=Microbispora oryzae TaxID=2806554 RepID=A0A941AJ58_9ACTN|nr:DUF4173 domain-containing protein [Microbispora oryzae]
MVVELPGSVLTASPRTPVPAAVTPGVAVADVTAAGVTFTGVAVAGVTVSDGVLPGDGGGPAARTGDDVPGALSSGILSSGVSSSGVSSSGVLSSGVSSSGVSSSGVSSSGVPSSGDAEAWGGPFGDRRSAATAIRAGLGAGLGMIVGFGAGLFCSFYLGYLLGGFAGLVLMLLLTSGGAVAGAVAGWSLPPRVFRSFGSFGSFRTPRPAGGDGLNAVDGEDPVDGGPAPPGGRPTDPLVYVPPPLFPRPELPPAPAWLLPAAAAVGILAAVALPYAPVGLGVAVTAVAMGAAVLPALPRERFTPWTVSAGLLAYALVSVALFRDADWLVAPALLLGFCIAALALSGGGRSWPGVIRGGVGVVLAVFPLPWFLSGPFGRLARRRKPVRALVSAVVTVVLLGLFGLLFSAADAVFSSFVHGLIRTPGWMTTLPTRLVLFTGFAVLVAASVLVALRPVAEPEAPDLRMRMGRALWAIPLLGLNGLFAVFVTVQIAVLFGGDRQVLSTAGLTYAQYARTGFFELVAVSVLVLGVVAAAVALLRLRTRAERLLLAALLGLLCAFTLVILASALHRLGLYTDAYGLSRLRAAVGAAIWWLGAVFVLVLAAGAVRLWGRRTAWLFRTLVLVTGTAVLVFASWNPDARVAETQVSIRGVALLDRAYLTWLSAEAVPMLDRLPEPTRTCILRDVVTRTRLNVPDGWSGWNLARARARALLDRRPLESGAICAGPS